MNAARPSATQSPTEFVFIYTPLPDAATAEAMGRSLVGAGLAACVNIYPGVKSVYEWKGEIQTDEEVIVFIKTKADMVEKVIAEARKLHPYEVPAFLLLPIIAGNEDYLAWARERLKAGS